MKLFLLVTIFFYLSTLKAEEDTNNDDIENPFQLFNNPADIKKQESFDDDNNPFKLVNSLKEDRNYTKEEFTIDILWHVHLIKIFMSKINENKFLHKEIEAKNYPIEVIFKLQLTEDLLNDLRKYSNNSNETSPSQINSYFSNLMKLERNMTNDILFEERNLLWKWWETKYLLFPFVCIILLCFMCVSKLKFILIVLMCALIHKGFELYEEEELRKRYIISQSIPEHCLKQGNRSFWDSLKFWQNPGKECIRYHQDLNKQTHHSVNIIKIIVASFSDFLVGMSDAISKLTASSYGNLSNYLPWYLTPLFTFILYLTPMLLFGFLFYKCFLVWFTHPRPVPIERARFDNFIQFDPVMKRGYPLSLHKRGYRKPKVIPYKKFLNK